MHEIWSRSTQRGPLRAAAGTLFATGLAIMAAGAGRLVLPSGESALIFILAVFLAAAWGGVWPGMGTAFLSALAFDFFFLDPLFSFSVADPKGVFALLMFLCMAVLTGSLAGRLREETDKARRHAATLQSLYDLVGQLSGAQAIEPLLEAAVGQIAAAADGWAVLLRPTGETWTVCASAPVPIALDTSDLEAARRSARDVKNAPAVATGWPGARLEFRPLVVRGRSVAVIGFAPSAGTPAAWRDADRALSALFVQITLAAERIAAEEESVRARTAAEKERLRSALLSSVSHDLRTPLATILGSITSLRQLGDTLPPSDREDLMAVIEEEAERLSRFVANLLHMTRLEAGIEPRRDWIDSSDVTHAAVKRARLLFPGRAIRVLLDPDAPPVQADSVLLEQALFNLVENALKYSSPEWPVDVGACRSASGLTFTVTDKGPGIGEPDLARVFEKFYRGVQSDLHPMGTGLGLAICRGIVTAFGGSLEAESPVAGGRGTRMRIELPSSRPLSGAGP